MQTIKLIHESSNLPWIVTGIITLISIFYNLSATKKTRFINTITSERIRWITTLKEYIAEYYSKSHSITNTDEEIIQKLNKCERLRLSILLYLNTEDDKELIKAINDNYSLLKDWANYNLKRETTITCQKQLDDNVENYNKSLELILYKSQELFKYEWERIKVESKKGDIKGNPNKRNKAIFTAKLHRGIRISIGIIGVSIAIMYKDDFQTMGTYATMIAFFGYALDGLLQTLKEYYE